MKRRDDLLLGPRERAIEAVKAGRREEAVRYIEELNDQFRPLHDRYGDWIQSLLGFVGEKLGEEAIEEALKRTFAEVYKDRALASDRMSHEDLVERYCQSLRSHYMEFYLEEDDEKTTIVITYCGSGGRMQKQGGAAGKRTSKAYPWSFNQAGVSYYCCHEGVFNNAYEQLGLKFLRYEYCNQFDDEGNPTGLPCRWIIYKRKR